MKKLALASLLLAASISFAQTTKPAATPAPTPEQKELIDKVNKASPAEPMAKVDVAPYNKDGSPNPNFGKTNSAFQKAHENFLKRKEKPIDVLFIGDSITQGWGNAGKKVWTERYEKLNAANFGIGGDRTQHVLWRIQEGELDGIKPKAVVVMIGTNNSGANTAEEITAGVKKIVEQINTKLPETKVLLLGIFPRGNKEKGGNFNPKVDTLIQAVNTELAKLDDGKKTRYLEIRKPFLNAEGTGVDMGLMPDALHLSEKGYAVWADTMQPLLDELLK